MLKKRYPNGETEVYTGLSNVDFYIPEANLCIEVDGSMHYYGQSKHELKRTQQKMAMMMQAGLNVVRVTCHGFSLDEPDKIFEFVER